VLARSVLKNVPGENVGRHIEERMDERRSSNKGKESQQEDSSLNYTGNQYSDTQKKRREM